MTPMGWNDLPPGGSAERLAFLRRLRHDQTIDLPSWLEAIEAGRLAPDADLLAILAPRLDAAGALRLLSHGLRLARQGRPEPLLLETAAGLRDPAVARALRDHLDPLPDAGLASVLLPLLGHQRQPRDFPLLQAVAIEPGPLLCRRGALEGLARGLSRWPEQDLASTLEALAGDLDPSLAETAVDLLARLPSGAEGLERLMRRPLAPRVRRRLERRLRGRLRSADRIPSAPGADCDAHGPGG